MENSSKTGVVEPPVTVSAKTKITHRVLDPDRIESSLTTWEPIIGGAVLIFVGVWVLMLMFQIVSNGVYAYFPEATDYISASLENCVFVSCVLAVMSIMGGALSMGRKYYPMCIVGALASLVVGLLWFYLYGVFAGLVGMALISVSYEQFDKDSQ